MTNGLTRRGFAGVALTAPFILRSARAAEPLLLRCSLDTAPSHGRNVSVGDYLQKLEKASNGTIKTQVFPSGQLFADLNVAKALVEGQVEMACPGVWVLTGVISDCDMFQLPIFYGQPIDVTRRATDGKAGAHINQQITDKLRTHVLGKWLDLGYQNWYSTSKPINSLADVKGMKVRSPGGAGISWRIQFWGGIPNTTAWPNVPLALSQGTFDGFVSTDESCASAKLYDSGVKHSFADHQYVGEYIPMVSHTFWGKLSPDQQKLMVDLWEQNIGAYRQTMLQRQVEARKTMEAHGVAFVDPSASEVADARKKMMAAQDSLIKDAKLSPQIVKLASEDIGQAA